MSPSTHYVIPEGERNCIWMEAGVVDYKLCNRQLTCDTCAFDAQLRTRNAEAHSGDTRRGIPPAVGRGRTPDSSCAADEVCQMTLQNILGAVERQALPDDRMYSLHHTWAKAADAGLSELGIDHFIAAMLGAVHSVAFSVPPTHIKAAEPYAWIVANGETLAVRSPIAGTIVENNHALAHRSSVVHSDPYGQGWIAKIRPDNDPSARTLRAPGEVSHVMKNDLVRYDRRIRSELRRLQTQLEGTMYDGGTVLENFEDILGTKKYYEILEQFLRP